jgi:hypothetical protein
MSLEIGVWMQKGGGKDKKQTNFPIAEKDRTDTAKIKHDWKIVHQPIHTSQKQKGS